MARARDFQAHAERRLCRKNTPCKSSRHSLSANASIHAAILRERKVDVTGGVAENDLVIGRQYN